LWSVRSNWFSIRAIGLDVLAENVGAERADRALLRFQLKINHPQRLAKNFEVPLAGKPRREIRCFGKPDIPKLDPFEAAKVLVRHSAVSSCAPAGASLAAILVNYSSAAAQRRDWPLRISRICSLVSSPLAAYSRRSNASVSLSRGSPSSTPFHLRHSGHAPDAWAGPAGAGRRLAAAPVAVAR